MYCPVVERPMYGANIWQYWALKLLHIGDASETVVSGYRISLKIRYSNGIGTSLTFYLNVVIVPTHNSLYNQSDSNAAKF